MSVSECATQKYRITAETSTRTIPRPPPAQAYPLTSIFSDEHTRLPGTGYCMADITGMSCMAGAELQSTFEKSTLGEKP